MSGTVLRLSPDEFCDVLDEINPVEVLVAELIGRALGGATWDPHRTGDWTLHEEGARAGGGGELAVLVDPVAGVKCLLPSRELRAVRGAALTALAACQLLTPGVVTVTVLGSGVAARLQLAVITRHVPDVSHIAVCTAGGRGEWPVTIRLVDQLVLAGIGLTVTHRVDEAVFGANLVVVAGDGHADVRYRQLPKGTVLVNATGRDLPHELVDAVDQVYVDDLRLLDGNLHRYFVRMHTREQEPRRGAPHRHTCWPRHRRIESDLVQVFTGKHAGRTSFDDILLVELLGADVLDAPLAYQVYQAAVALGLGTRTSDQPS